MRADLTLPALLLLASTTLSAAPPERPAVALGQKYIVKLKYLVVQPNASAAAPIRSLIPSLGKIDRDWSDRLVVTIPAAALPAIKAHPAVRYVQQVVNGPFTNTTSTATIDAPRTVESQRLLVPNSSPPWSSGTYTYDGAGNITNIGPGSVSTDSFQYDAVSRLVHANVRGHDLSYNYDPFGNLTGKTEHVASMFSVDAHTNRLTTEQYDTAGNDTGDGSSETFAYDPFNMMREKDVGMSSTFFVYTPNDERIGAIACGQSSCVGQDWTWSVRDESGNVLRQYQSRYDAGLASEWTWMEDYVYRDGLLLGAERVPEEGGRRHFHLDHLGTPRVVTNDAGNKMAEHDYYPFGLEISNPPSQPAFQDTANGWDREEPMRFAGYERDLNIGSLSENDNYNDSLHARQIVPAWGRFLSIDPSRHWDPSRPQSWNRYAYVMNNPLNRVDPDGKDWRQFADFVQRHIGEGFAHFKQADEAFRNVLVARVGTNIRVFGGGVNAGPVRLQGAVQIVPRTDANGKVTVAIRGEAGGGVEGTPAQLTARASVGATLLENGRLASSIDPQFKFDVTSNGMKASSGELTMNLGAFGVSGELGVNFREAARGMSELSMGFSEVVHLALPVKPIEPDDPQQ